jgi:hypothetical protein
MAAFLEASQGGKATCNGVTHGAGVQRSPAGRYWNGAPENPEVACRQQSPDRATDSEQVFYNRVRDVSFR